MEIPNVKTFAELVDHQVNPHEKFLWEAVIRSFKPELLDAVDSLRALCELCESPIERYFLAGAFEYARKEGYELMVGGKSLTPGALSVTLEMQRNIGQHRADFVLWHQGSGVVVECDGQAFHKDKAKDAERDQYMTKRNYRVIRFTGSDLYRDPAECAHLAFAEALRG